jgi:hypothetical protein
MRFEKGNQAAKGHGAPKKGERAADYLRKHITEDQVALAVAKGALAGDKDMIRLCAEYFWGKPVQKNENEINGNLKLQLVFGE